MNSWHLPFESSFAETFARDKLLVAPDAIPSPIVEEWERSAMTLATERAVTIARADGDHILDYEVVAGDVIKEHGGALYSFYTDPSTARWVQRVTGDPDVTTSEHLRSSININYFSKPSQRYRWHFDAAPYTLLLYLSELTEDGGGEIEIYPNLLEGRRDPEWEEQATSQAHLENVSKLVVRPQAGTLILMDGSLCYHRVLPLKSGATRLSVPMVFPAEESERPQGLDEYLHGGGS